MKFLNYHLDQGVKSQIVAARYYRLGNWKTNMYEFLIRTNKINVIDAVLFEPPIRAFLFDEESLIFIEIVSIHL